MDNDPVNRRWFGGLPFGADTRPLFQARSSVAEALFLFSMVSDRVVALT
jgi:hypothetical protein